MAKPIVKRPQDPRPCPVCYAPMEFNGWWECPTHGKPQKR